MRFGSVCSGIEAASVAWHPLGWRAAWLAEIEPFPSALLAHHYPEVPNLGDMTALPGLIASGAVEAPDVFCGGTPCQAFSVAGLRRSLDDARGNLSLVFCEIADAIDRARAARGEQPAIVFWENVPGVLSTKDNAFGCFLAGLAGEEEPLKPAGPRWSDAGVVLGPERAVAWRVLDAQFFGVAQRRRRVFVVASARDDFDPVAVLFEFDGVRRDFALRRESGTRITTCLDAGPEIGGDGSRVSRLVTADDMVSCITGDITHALNTANNGKGSSEDGTGRGTPLVPVAFHPTQDPISSTDGSTHAMGCGSKQGAATVAVAFDTTQITSAANRSNPKPGDPCHPLAAGAHAPAIATAVQVRRLTPRECERLQGFPDDYTLIPWRGKPADLCPDGPRYKALGNSWAVPVVRWIGARINEQLLLA